MAGLLACVGTRGIHLVGVGSFKLHARNTGALPHCDKSAIIYIATIW